jgi:hypothetical protein
MALPKLNTPIHRWKSLDGHFEYQIRPFTVKEQKILLNTKEAIKNEDDVYKRVESMLFSIEQIFNNCIINRDVNDIPSYDFPFLMLELRKISVDNISTIAYECRSKKEDGEICGNRFKININLDNVNIKGNVLSKKEDMTIKFDDVGVVMKYPTFSQFKRIYTESLNEYNVLRIYVDHMFDNDNVYSINDATDEEIEQFVIDAGKEFKKIKAWIDGNPLPYFYIEHKCSKCGNVKNIELKNVQDFF